MYASESLMFEYFFKENKELTLLEIDQKFDSSDYKELLDSLTPLMRQNIIEQPKHEVWIITDIGRKEYLLRQLDKKTKLREDWYKRNWLLADAIKYVIGFVLGAIITATTLLTCNLSKHQENKLQYPVMFQDTLNKK
jgi:hypothetical protein